MWHNYTQQQFSRLLRNSGSVWVIYRIETIESVPGWVAGPTAPVVSSRRSRPDKSLIAIGGQSYIHMEVYELPRR